MYWSPKERDTKIQIGSSQKGVGSETAIKKGGREKATKN